jgi:tetratricopeptide (TPR) repeat protein
MNRTLWFSLLTAGLGLLTPFVSVDGIIDQKNDAHAQTASPPAEPILRVQGELRPGDAVMRGDNTLYDTYTFTGRAGQTITIVMESLGFDTYLLLLDPNQKKIAENDDYGNGNLNAVISITLPQDGTYTVLANAHDAQGRGQYTLTVLPGNTPVFSAATLRQSEAKRLVLQGIQQQRTSQYATALQSFQAAIAIYREVGDRAGEGSVLNNIGAVYADQGRYTEALSSYQQALTIAREIGDRTREGTRLNNIGTIYGNQGRYAEAITAYEQALAINRVVGDRVTESRTLNNIGRIYNDLGRYAEAITAYEQALTINRVVGDRAGEGIALGNLGNVYISLGQHPQAIQLLEQRLAIAREIGDRRREGVALGDLGNAYEASGQFRRAIEFYEQGLLIEKAIGNRVGESRLLGNLGNAYNALEQYVQAINSYQESLTIAREIGDRVGEGTALSNIAYTYSKQESYQVALNYYNRALIIFRQISNKQREANILNNLASTYSSLRDYSQAVNLYEQALTIHRELSDRLGEVTVLSNLGNTYQAMGRYSQALSFYELASAIRGSLREGARTFQGELQNPDGSVAPQTLEFAMLSAGTDKLQEATNILLSAIEILENLRSGLRRDVDRVSIFETQIGNFVALQTALVAQEKSNQALEISERSRARIFVELLHRRNDQYSNEPRNIDVIPSLNLQQIQQTAKMQNATIVQ